MSCCVTGVAFSLVKTFFSTCDVINIENVPTDDPMIVVVNHNNQFVDAAVVSHILPRKGSFIIAEASMHRLFVGDLAKMAKAVPVVRPQDRAVVGSGSLVDLNLESRILTGQGTNFTGIEILVPKAKIDIKNVFSFTVEEIISDTEIRFKVTEEEEEELEKVAEKFTTETPQSYKVMPYINQKDTYQAVYKRLEENGCIVIFPEGGSHDRPTLLPLKPGVAVMALGGIKAGVKNLKIMAIGLNYCKADVFRSRVLVEVGDPFSVPDQIYEKFEEGDRRGAYQDLMEMIKDKMEDVTLNAPNYKTQKIMQTARRLYQNGAELNADQYLTLYRRFLRGYEKWKDEEEFQHLLKEIEAYLKQLKTLGLKDKQLETAPQSNSCFTLLKVLFQITFSLLVTTFLLVLALPGMILNLPLFLVVRRKVNKERKKALKKSKVKIHATDVAASQKVINTVKYIVPMYLLNSVGTLVILFFAYERQNEDEQQFFLDNLFWFVPLLLFFILPFYTLFCSFVLESAVRRYSLLPGRFFTVKQICNRHSPSCLGGSSVLSPEADVRVKRRELIIKTQDLVKELTKEDEEWQSDPIIPFQIMDRRRKVLLKYMVQMIERTSSDKTLLTGIADEELKKVLEMTASEQDQYLTDAL